MHYSTGSSSDALPTWILAVVTVTCVVVVVGIIAIIVILVRKQRNHTASQQTSPHTHDYVNKDFSLMPERRATPIILENRDTEYADIDDDKRETTQVVTGDYEAIHTYSNTENIEAGVTGGYSSLGEDGNLSTTQYTSLDTSSFHDN